MRLHAAIALGLVVMLAGCASFKRKVIRPDKNPPVLRTRPNLSGPHYAVPTLCMQKLEWYEGWCETGDKPGQLLCHDVVVTVPESCRVLSVNKVP